VKLTEDRRKWKERKKERKQTCKRLGKIEIVDFGAFIV
jgi:hypothetical protein